MKDVVGKVFKTNNYGDLVIIQYNGCYNVKVKFIDTGYETTTEFSSIKKGKVRDRLLPSVFGVGVIGDESVWENGYLLKEYTLWHGMLGRCYDEKSHVRSPTYQDCSVSSNFTRFSYFKDWCHNQVGFNCLDDVGKPFQLDKDILVKGNKLYGEDTCCFVPQVINALLLQGTHVKDGLSLGVSYRHDMKKFRARHGKVLVGWFDTEVEAFQA